MAQGLASTRIPRNKLFLTTKFFPSGPPQPAKQVTDGLRTSLKKLDQFGGKGYIDLVLIHAPYGGPEGRARHWEGLVNAQKEGWVKDIGVSNFGVKHLKELPGPTPAINQIELHPWCQQRDIVSYCQQNGVIVQAYCPLVRADKKRLEDPVVTKIAEKHGKQGSHVILRWSLQKGFVPLPKSVTPSRIKSNADLYDFVLDEEDMKELDSLDEGAAGACSWNPVNEE
ncbi:aldo-keto reductase [Tremella mesenterica]|uniref:Aldo-keto reductase n=1 Tax=Tremella mesenterica TaxID=5217 RepID=A0A4Q1BJP1_TREME|nr:aldo-keto reductase [Tremella mesenterica]